MYKSLGKVLSQKIIRIGRYSSLSLDLPDSLDDILDFEEELKSADSDTVLIMVKFQVQASRQALRTMTASDDSDLYGEGASATKKKQ